MLVMPRSHHAFRSENIVPHNLTNWLPNSILRESRHYSSNNAVMGYLIILVIIIKGNLAHRFPCQLSA